MNPAPFVEIDIRRLLFVDPATAATSGLTTIAGFQAEDAERYRTATAAGLSSRDVVAKIDAAKASGTPALVLNLESLGGGADAMHQVIDALRSYQVAGGKVVAFIGNDGRSPEAGQVAGVIGSSAPAIALQADFVVMDAAARMAFHSAHHEDPQGRLTIGAELNEWMVAHIRARSCVELSTARSLVAPTHTAPGQQVLMADARQAEVMGMIDLIGPIHAARWFACSRDWTPQTSRRQWVLDARERSARFHGTSQVPAPFPRSPGADAVRCVIGASAVTPQAVAAGAIGAAARTFGTRNTNNLWPNPSSEDAPASGIDLTGPEWNWRTNAGGGAYAGSYVRRATGTKNLELRIPAAQGDTFYMSAMVHRSAGAHNVIYNGGVLLWYEDDAGNMVPNGTAFVGASTSDSGSIWALQECSMEAPANAVTAVLAIANVGANTFDYDAILAVKMTPAKHVVPGNTPQVMVTKGSPAVAQWVDPASAWTAVSYTNSWVDYGAPRLAVGYCIDALGVVRLRGTMASGVVGSAAFTLPGGYRPSATVGVLVLTDSGTGEITITSGGAVTLTTGGTNGLVSLDGISFDTR